MRSDGLLAGVTATCLIPPFVACAVVPVYAAAVAAATLGQVLSLGAMASGIVSMGLQLTATMLYANLNDRTTKPHSALAVPISAVSDTTVADLKAAYVTSKGLAQTAYNAVPAPAPNVATLKATQEGKASILTADIANVSDLTLNALLSASLNGGVSTCTLTSTADCS